MQGNAWGAAIRAHLLEMAGEAEAARAEFQVAAARTLSAPERRYLEDKAAVRRVET